MPEDVASKVNQFFNAYRLKRYDKGQILILNGDRSGHIFYLVSGTVKVYDVTPNGDEIILNIFKPPAFFPVSQALNKAPSQFIYEAATAIEFRQAPATAVLELLMANNDITLDLLARVYKGTDGLMGRMAALMSGTAKSRLMLELLIEARRFGKSLKDGAVLLELNEKDLGERTGLSRETVSREFKKLKAEGLVEVRPKQIQIKDLAELRRNQSLEI